jgi:hypothetical protein
MKQQIRKLTETATALRTGTSTYFPITRLTSIKGLCKDPATAAHFVFYLAERTLEKVRAGDCPSHIEPRDWVRYQQIIAQAVAVMADFLQGSTENSRAELASMLRAAEAVQPVTGRQVWGHLIRTIHCTDVLVIEDAIRCMTSPEVSSYLAYQTAKDYTECYNPRFGTGLIPESVPMLDDIINFWTNQNSGNS